MSKLVEKLERISESSGQPIGFGAAASRRRVDPMLIIASVSAESTRLMEVAGKEGIDAIVITVEDLARDKRLVSKLDSARIGVPWGVLTDKVVGEDLEQLIERGCDFVIFSPARTPAAVLNEDRIGKVLRIDPSLTDSMIRTVGRLSVDAVFLSPFSDEEPHFTVQQLMIYERLAGGTGKHLLAALPLAKPPSDIESLWALGVRGVIVDFAGEQPEHRLREVKEAIQKLPATRKKPKEKIRATLPLAKIPSVDVQPEEDEE
jgi:hypothetical protein